MVAFARQYERFIFPAPFHHEEGEDKRVSSGRWIVDGAEHLFPLIDADLWPLASHYLYIENQGTLIIATSPGLNRELRYLYTCQEWDGIAGLYYYDNRWYDSATGRFWSQDAIGFDAGDMNLYRYVGNSPINRNDPLGLYAVCCRTEYEKLPIGIPGCPSLQVGIPVPYPHCWVTSGSCPKDSKETPASVDDSPNRCMNGKPCSQVTAEEIQACLNKNSSWQPYPDENYGIGNNCNTGAIHQLGNCCLKSKWKPPLVAGPPRGKCLSGHWEGQITSFSNTLHYVCDQWELPDWQM